MALFTWILLNIWTVNACTGGGFNIPHTVQGDIVGGDTVQIDFFNSQTQNVAFTDCASDFDPKMRVFRKKDNITYEDITGDSDNIESCRTWSDGFVDDCFTAEAPCARGGRETLSYTNLVSGFYRVDITPYWPLGGRYVLAAHAPSFGCSSAAANEYPISEHVYACSGTIASGGVLGTDAAALCFRGHVCRSAIESEEKGLTEALCAAIPGTTHSQFFAAQESSGGSGKCESYNPSNPGYDDIWGCKRGDSSVFPTNLCGVLNGAIGNRDYGAWDYSAATRSTELSAYKLRNAAFGGVLCCSEDGDSSLVDPLSFIPSETVFDFRIYVIISILAICFILISSYVWFITKKINAK